MEEREGKRWLPEEDQILRDNYKKMPYAQMGLLLPSRKIKAIVNRAYRLSIGYRTDLWKPEEEKALRESYLKNGRKKTGWLVALAKSMNRSPGNLVRKANQLGIQTDDHRRKGIRSEYYLAKEKRKLWTPEQWKEFRQSGARLSMEVQKKKHDIVTDEEWGLWFGKFIREHHAAEGHPRGMLGKRHSDKSRKQMSHSRTGKKLPPLSEERKRELSLRMSERLRNMPHGMYSRCKSGKRADLNDRFFRSSWEANYVRFMNWQKIEWAYEIKTFWFEEIKRGTRSYTPDFWLPKKDEFHEVKGWMDPKSVTRMKRMALYYPEVKIVIVDKEFFNDIEKQRLCRIIPGWECAHRYDILDVE